MKLTQMTLEQTLILAVYVLLGVGMTRLKLIEQKGIPSLTNLVLYLVNPFLILDSFSTMRLEQRLVKGMLVTALFAVMIHLISILIVSRAFQKEEDAKRRVMVFCAVFSNNGFFGIPLLQAIAGSEGVFYGAIYIAVFKMFCWTYGVALMDESSGKESGGLAKAFFNPNSIAILIGLALFFTQLKPPAILGSILHNVGLLNSPLAMLLVGVQVGTLGVWGFHKSREVWKTTAMRMVILPLIALFIAWALIPERTLAVCCLIPAAAPTAVMAVMFAEKYKQDVRLSAQIVTLTTLSAILMIPGMVSLFDFLNHL